jgi:hypothetical protein
VHEPLSQRLALVLKRSQLEGNLTLNRLLEHTDGRSVYLLVILLCVPFLIPVSLPGLSTVMGAIIALLMIRQLLGKAARLPGAFGSRTLPPGVQRRVIGGSIGFLRWLEKLVKPRRAQWMSWRPVALVNRLLIVFLALLLALPLPAPPFFFSNSIPSYAIVVLAASMMEEDGVSIWVGYALALVNFVFFALIGGVVVEVFLKVWDTLVHRLLGL